MVTDRASNDVDAAAVGARAEAAARARNCSLASNSHRNRALNMTRIDSDSGLPIAGPAAKMSGQTG